MYRKALSTVVRRIFTNSNHLGAISITLNNPFSHRNHAAGDSFHVWNSRSERRLKKSSYSAKFKNQLVQLNNLIPNDISSFCDHIDTTLPKFPSEVLNCCDPDCTSHHLMLNFYYKQLLNSIAAAADLCLPKQHHSGRSPSSLSGWNNATLSLKQSARFWHKVWTECGCPTTGVLFQIKKNSKRGFKCEVRRLLNCQTSTFLVLLSTVKSKMVQ